MKPDDVARLLCDPETLALGDGYYERDGELYHVTAEESAAFTRGAIDRLRRLLP